MTVRVVGDGSLGGTRVYLEDGTDVTQSVTRVSWEHEVGGFPTVEVDLNLVPVDAAGEVRWQGLEKVPEAALRAELERREAEDPPYRDGVMDAREVDL